MDMRHRHLMVRVVRERMLVRWTGVHRPLRLLWMLGVVMRIVVGQIVLRGRVNRRRMIVSWVGLPRTWLCNVATGKPLMMRATCRWHPPVYKRSAIGPAP